MSASTTSTAPTPSLLPAQRLNIFLRQPIWGLALVLLGCFASGALLAAFEAPLMLWLMACGVLLYLVWSTTEAIFLSNLWLMGVFAVVVGLRPWPSAWESFSAWNDARMWAMVLMGLWFLHILLLTLVAFTAKSWQKRYSQRFQRWCMALLSCFSLSLGFWSQ